MKQPPNERELTRLLARVEGILERVEGLLPSAPAPADWSAHAFRWRKRAGRGFLEAVLHPHSIRLGDLVAIDEQKRAIDANTRQFVLGLPANNVLLTGSRGTGKSSLVKAMLVKYAAKGLRLIEVDKAELVELPDIATAVAGRRERFIVFCDDLSFDAGDPGYKALKVMLDGTIAAAAANLLIYATSNRRHLMPEYFSENLETKHLGGEVHPGESVEEKISLSERFGPVGVVLSVQPGRLPRCRRVVAGRVRRRRTEIVARNGGPHPRSGAIRAAARLEERPRCVAIRQELRPAPRRPAPKAVSKTLLHVAAAIIVRPDGRVLLAQRPAGKAYAGYWEFPGGKLEQGETSRAALDRELHEELGLTVRRAAPWLVQQFRYPHAHVLLHFFRVFEWDGEPVGHDGQAFVWQIAGGLLGAAAAAGEHVRAARIVAAVRVRHQHGGGHGRSPHFSLAPKPRSIAD